jgi:hypothetical protein
VTARCTKAIEQLGSDRLDVRVGGIYALERIAHDSPRDHLAVLEVLAAFIREQRSRAMVTERARRGDARAGNAARCTGCGRRNWAPNPQARPGVSLACANPAPRTSPAHPGARMRQFPGLATAPTRAAGSRPILARAVRQPTCYALTGLPYLLSGICTGASSRHGMAGGAPGSATRARSVGSCRGECQAARQPCAWQDTTRCPGPRVRAASAGVHSHGIHDTIPRPPLVAVRALRQATPPGRPPHVHDTMETPVRSGARQRAVLPGVDRSRGSSSQGSAGKRTRRRYRSAAAWWAKGPAGNHLRVPADRSREPTVPDGEVPPKMAPEPLQMLVKQRSRNPRSRSRHGPNRWNRRQCRHRCPRQCRRHRRRNPGRSRGHCRRRNRNRTRSQYRTQSRTGAAAGGAAGSARRVRLLPHRRAVPIPAHGPRLSRRCTVAARSCATTTVH